MGLSQRLSLAAYWASMTAWALVMVGFGLLIAIDLPGRPRMTLPAPILVLLGAALVAAGEFVFALVASRMFPLANPRLTATIEVLPIVGFVAVAMSVFFLRNQ
jgi:hypothetical protein